jgi:hypothetical protein
MEEGAIMGFGWDLPPGCSLRDIDPQHEEKEPSSLLVAAGKITDDALSFLLANGATIEMFGAISMVSFPASARSQSVGTGDYTIVFSSDSDYDGPYLVVEQTLDVYCTHIKNTSTGQRSSGYWFAKANKP